MKYHHTCFDMLLVFLMGCAIPSIILAEPVQYYVEPVHGNDGNAGSMDSPLKTLTAALEKLPAEIDGEVLIHLSPGEYKEGGEKKQAALELKRRMHGNGQVRIIGETAGYQKNADPEMVLLDWTVPGKFLLEVNEGRWSLENVQIGSRQAGQGKGICVTGPGLLELHKVRIHTSGEKGAGLRAEHGGRIELFGTIELNEDLMESGGNENNFCRIEAEYGGVVRFMQREGARLVLGNGNLSAAYYGVIELGCEEARISSWNYQSNPIAINNSGRIDLHNTTTRLCAHNPRNTPIGLEHDGHVLAEGAKIIIEGKENANAIVLQKASTFFCNDVAIEGSVKNMLQAMSGSFLLAGIQGDLGRTEAYTGATIIVESCTGRLAGPFQESRGGRIILPDGKAAEPESQGSDSNNSDVESQPADLNNLPPLHRAALGGHLEEAQKFIREGADVKGRGPGGWTPLHMAAMGGHRAMAEMLLGQGAEIKARDDEGRTPADWAVLNSHEGLAEFLSQKEKGQ